MSCIGSLLGLLFTARARATSGASRGWWLVLGALAIGGTGIWVMHFIAMLGFSIPRATIRYDVPLTLVSALIAVVVVGVGLFTVGFGGPRQYTLLAGGALAGIGVASMHYTGMLAMRATAQIRYDAGMVALSVLIAIAAATAALWFTALVRGAVATIAAALIMGVAVSGMHYTGMAAMRVRVDTRMQVPSGAPPADFLLPLIIAISVITMLLLTILAMSPNEEEMRLDAALVERIHQRRMAADGDLSYYLPGTHGNGNGHGNRNGNPNAYRPSGDPHDPSIRTGGWFDAGS
ncbi:MAG TPA: MHYT domain-containing protein [Streptosporangiaceae bacterium]|nr:MHYT domain-containing protein [Streptosporangiaceae bacterium]